MYIDSYVKSKQRPEYTTRWNVRFRKSIIIVVVKIIIIINIIIKLL